MPVKAAGWRIDPPVSVPIAARHKSAATADADPPEDPPGVSNLSEIFHGFITLPYTDVSFELPIANSSMFNLPRVTAPEFFKFCVTVLSYPGLKPSKILLAA